MSTQRTHIVGIKGAGVSALAKILRARGEHICGSDVVEQFFTDQQLAREGIRIEPFTPSHVSSDPLDRVIYSTAWNDSEEVHAARRRGLLLLSYPEALGEFFNGMDTRIAIAGSHGKTTTTALVAHILKKAGYDINAIIGSSLIEYETNAFAGSESMMVIEADEYENKFSCYEPNALLVTSIDYDHPDFFSDSHAYDETFQFFVQRVREKHGAVVACGDDTGVKRVFRRKDAVLYGTDPSYPYAVKDMSLSDGRQYYTLLRQGEDRGRYSISLVGKHNVLNVLGAIALCDTIGLVRLEQAAEYADVFQGTARRFEHKGFRGKMHIYDDFAHHPTEIAATLSAARERFGTRRIWCVFGAHTYTRTRAFLDAFAKSFHHADHVLLLDIYGSAREQSGGIHGRDLAAAIADASGNAEYVGTKKRACEIIESHVDEIDVLITMGAGDVYQITDRLLDIKY